MDNSKKNNGKKTLKIVLYVLAALIAAALVVIPFLLESVQDAMEQKASILSGTVETGDISMSVSGTGTLTDAEAIEITIPEGVELTEYLVSEGDMVSEGDLIARTDRTSVMQAINSVQETLDYLSEELTDADEGSSTQTVCANTAGKVKAVYAAAGDSVQSVMLEHGCLAVVSIDGYMAAQLETVSLSAGDSVTVTMSDGNPVGGLVEVVRNGEATIIFSDKYGSIGETVDVAGPDGTELGQAELYVHSEWRAVAYTGTVSSVRCSEGSNVSSGAVMFNLKDTLTTATYDSLVSQRREYEDMMKRLFEMYMNGGLAAPCDGIVSGLDDDLITELASTGNEGYRVMLLAANNPDGTSDAVYYTNQIGMVTSVNETGTLSMKLGGYYNSITDYAALPGFATTEDSLFLTAEIPLPMGRIYYSYDTNNLSWSQMTGVPQPGDVFLITYDGGGIKWMIYVGHNEYTPQEDPNGGNGNQGSGQSISIPSGFSFGGYGYTQEEEFELFSTEETVAAAVIPPDKMTVTITVDELDILQLSTGMDAQLTIDALPGQSFPGTVTSIDTTASNSGGNTKFTAEITVERNGYMLSGMNTGILIVTSEKTDVPVIPAEALCQEGTKTIVYRGYDEENECLIDPVEVETGVSDGINVEILSGLEPGDTYRYAYLDTLDIYSMFNR